MFIPKGKTVHENLATSYVLVDALVSDLCEGGFSGIVEIVLRNSDSYVVIDRGEVAAVLQKGGPSGYVRVDVSGLATQAGRERGRLSVYSYSAGTAEAVAGLLTAESLYTRLSAEFTDLEKMISKLGRENDRQWFIRVDTENGTTALIHIEGERCRVIMPGGEMAESRTGNLDLAENAALRNLIEECNAAGGAFDVYFKLPAPIEPQETKQAIREAEEPGIEEPPRQPDGGNGSPVIESLPDYKEPAVDPSDEFGQSVEAGTVDAGLGPALRDEDIENREERESLVGMWASVLPDSTSDAPRTEPEIYATGNGQPYDTEPQSDESHPDSKRAEAESESMEDESEAAHNPPEELPPLPEGVLETSDLSLAKSDLLMADVKRLMGEMTRTIEDVTRIVEQKDNFAMHLRAGQLKVADRYPFLDPFGAEFEYLAGEIAFVGKASAEEFIEGVTEALSFAVVEILESASHPARLRAIIAEDLRKLSSRNRQEFDMFDLDPSIEKIISS